MSMKWLVSERCKGCPKVRADGRTGPLRARPGGLPGRQVPQRAGALRLQLLKDSSACLGRLPEFPYAAHADSIFLARGL